MKYLFPPLLMLLMTAALLYAQTSPTSNTNDTEHKRSLILSEQVHIIFLNHCAQCHGPDLDDPEGGFDFILNLKQLAADPNYIVPTKPDQSYIWEVIESDEMPPPDSDIPPLSEKQKETVKWWIESGAATRDQSTVIIHDIPLTERTVTIDQPRISASRKIIQFLGQFHPASSHFPISLLLVAALSEFLLITTQQHSLKSITRFTLWLGAFAALLATALGLFDAAYLILAPHKQWILNTHRFLGIATTILAFLALISLEYHSVKPESRSRLPLRIILFIIAPLICCVGFFGSALVFGIDHYTW
ncbi:Planctomycete cytochrome C [Poriferisphaera corsica]|uniref:Planctomycete cytochrome C n=1 Tax=Poriferisphaera corsica TaxID=2528020 RepID=A0A517YRN7_9BACT|nr:DUF2231 domain-containing protein [Poriferisphaera corsica]QDU32892.1 Planctomycete cytochrome C [Poriferisphaera corsica]